MRACDCTAFLAASVVAFHQTAATCLPLVLAWRLESTVLAGEGSGYPGAAANVARQVNVIDPQQLYPGHMVGEGAYGKVSPLSSIVPVAERC